MIITLSQRIKPYHNVISRVLKVSSCKDAFIAGLMKGLNEPVQLAPGVSRGLAA